MILAETRSSPTAYASRVPLWARALARRRREQGETWQEIAARYGVPWLRLRYAVARYSTEGLPAGPEPRACGPEAAAPRGTEVCPRCDRSYRPRPSDTICRRCRVRARRYA